MLTLCILAIEVSVSPFAIVCVFVPGGGEDFADSAGAGGTPAGGVASPIITPGRAT